MNQLIYCYGCNLEYRLKYEGDGLFIPQFCPFCGEETDPDEQYAVEEDFDEG